MRHNAIRTAQVGTVGCCRATWFGPTGGSREEQSHSTQSLGRNACTYACWADERMFEEEQERRGLYQVLQPTVGPAAAPVGTERQELRPVLHRSLLDQVIPHLRVVVPAAEARIGCFMRCFAQPSWMSCISQCTE